MCEDGNRFHQLSCLSVRPHELIMQSAAFQTHAFRCILQLLRWCHCFQSGFLRSVVRRMHCTIKCFHLVKCGGGSLSRSFCKLIPHINEDRNLSPPISQSRGQLQSCSDHKNILGSLWTFGHTAEFIVPVGPLNYSWYEWYSSSMIYLSLQPISISHTAM